MRCTTGRPPHPVESSDFDEAPHPTLQAGSPRGSVRSQVAVLWSALSWGDRCRAERGSLAVTQQMWTQSGCRPRWPLLTAPWAVPSSVSWEHTELEPSGFQCEGKAPRFLALLWFLARGCPASAQPAPGCSRWTQSCQEEPHVSTWGASGDHARRVLGSVAPLAWGPRTVGMPGG